MFGFPQSSLTDNDIKKIDSNKEFDLEAISTIRD